MPKIEEGFFFSLVEKYPLDGFTGWQKQASISISYVHMQIK